MKSPLFIFACLLLLATNSYADQIRVVDLTDDLDETNGTCNLREAIEAANEDQAYDACPAGNGADIIIIDVTGTLSLLSTLPTLSEDLTIIGPGRENFTVDGMDSFRIIMMDGDQETTISGLTLTRGYALTNGGAIWMNSNSFNDEILLTLKDVTVSESEASSGGGIYAEKELILERCAIIGNRALQNGGGIYTAQSLDMSQSTVSDNYAEVDGGGLDIHNGDHKIYSSTISGNRAGEDGGGIHYGLAVNATSDFSLFHSTITNNAVSANQATPAQGDGGGVYISFGNTVNFFNNIIARNFDFGLSQPSEHDVKVLVAPDLFLSSYNLIGDHTGAESLFPLVNSNDNIVGDSSSPVDPKLEGLANNGGATMTHSPRDISVDVLDKGSCEFQIHDQRAYAGSYLTRTFDLRTFPNTEFGCDIGSVEYESSIQPLDFQIKLLLDGAYAGAASMHTDLIQYLPIKTPYFHPPWNQPYTQSFNSIPSNMVDWVMVSLYQGVPGNLNLEYQGSYGLGTSGQLIKPNNFYNPLLSSDHPFYIVVHHRNHLPVMSAYPYTLSDGIDTSFYDFSNSGDAAFTNSGSALRDREDGSFTIWGGNGIPDSGVTAFDFLNVWLPQNGGPNGYHMGDFDLNSNVTAFDFLNIWLPANGTASQLPF